MFAHALIMNAFEEADNMAQDVKLLKLSNATGLAFKRFLFH